MKCIKYLSIAISITSFNTVSGQLSPPPGHYRPCRMLEEPIFSSGGDRSEVLDWTKDGINGYKVRVQWWPPPLGSGTYIPGGVGPPPPPISFPAERSQPDTRITTHYANSNNSRDGVIASSENFYIKYRHPCNDNGPLLTGHYPWSTYTRVYPPPKDPTPNPPKPAADIPPGDIEVASDPYLESSEDNAGECEAPGSFTAGVCKNYVNTDTRGVGYTTEVNGRVDIVAENINFKWYKQGFMAYNGKLGANKPPKFYMQETAMTALQGGNPESTVGGHLKRKICRMTDDLIITEKSGNPSWSGVRDWNGVTLSETVASGYMDIQSYDDCPNMKDDEPGRLVFTSTLSDENTTDMMRSNAFAHAWQFRNNPRSYNGSIPPIAKLLIDKDETEIEYWKTQYKIRIAQNVQRPYKAIWYEKFTPEDTDPDDGQVMKPTFKYKSEWITGNESQIHKIDPADNPRTEGEWVVGLLPLQIAVDADRDGSINVYEDLTTEAKPYRFWINNDQDDVEHDEPVSVQDQNCDLVDSTIKTNRDLEDFTRVTVHAPWDLDDLKSGKCRVGLKIINPKWGAPAIRLWINEAYSDSHSYLVYSNSAIRQRSQLLVGDTQNGTVYIPKAYWVNRPLKHDDEVNLIFEGTSRGQGELVVVMEVSVASSEVDSAPVHLELLDVREMYQRARVANEAEQIPSPATNPTPPAQTWVWDQWNWPYSEDPQATEKTAIFVHGWRLKYMDYINWSDTSYKRLWHQGFKGKFYSFRWATFSGDNNGLLPYGLDEQLEANSGGNSPVIPPGGTTYNASEYRAWLCGPTLALFVNQLPNAGNRSLFAHSMGNVISGAALRSGMLIDRYAMCNAAMAAMAYDPNPILRNVDNIYTPVTIPELRDTPDSDPDPAIRANYGLENKFNLPGKPEVFNFGLPDDSALGSWSANNLYFKPNNQYLYTENSILQPFPLVYQATPVSSFRSVTAVPEAMGYVTKSRTRTAGADLRTSGKIAAGNKIDMSSWGTGTNHSGFGNTHSAQWRWSNQSTELFWKELSIRLILKEENP
jgi:hypothetical protein